MVFGEGGANTSLILTLLNITNISAILHLIKYQLKKVDSLYVKESTF